MNSPEVRACKHQFVTYFDQSGDDPIVEGMTCTVCWKRFYEKAADSILITREQLRELIEAADEVGHIFDPDMRNHFHFTRLRKVVNELRGKL